MKKIKIAVSSCLLGEAVRYDGTDKYLESITNTLALEYNLISLCPEMAVAMGVPRRPIHLVEDGNRVQVVGIEDPSCNMTTPIEEYGKKIAKTYPDISGYIFTRNSPSCGTKNVRIMNAKGIYERKGKGIYAASIMSSLPLLPVVDDEEFMNVEVREKFLFYVMIYSQLQNITKGNQSVETMQGFNYDQKMAGQEYPEYLSLKLNKLLSLSGKSQLIQECVEILKANRQ